MQHVRTNVCMNFMFGGSREQTVFLSHSSLSPPLEFKVCFFKLQAQDNVVYELWKERNTTRLHLATSQLAALISSKLAIDSPDT
uniref:Uncharacterized protein n=1 Tax=Noccaea caerulescens TaxID=107243 RepID=A0A1J3GFS8_NOCCA